MAYRARQSDFYHLSTTPWMNVWAMRVRDRIKNVLTPDLFLTVRELLRPGDIITLTAFEDSEERVKDIAEVRIVQVHADRVEFLQVGDIITIPENDGKVAKGDELGMEVTVKRIFGAYVVQNDEGHAIEQFKTKAQAEKYAEEFRPQ